MCLAIEKMRNETKQAIAETKQAKAKSKRLMVKQTEEKTNRLVAVLKALGKSDSEIDAYLNG